MISSPSLIQDFLACASETAYKDTELYIVGKDVAELKISKKFRFEKISSDFKMSILLYGKIYGTILLFGIVLKKTFISGQLPVNIETKRA